MTFKGWNAWEGRDHQELIEPAIISLLSLEISKNAYLIDGIEGWKDIRFKEQMFRSARCNIMPHRFDSCGSSKNHLG